MLLTINPTMVTKVQFWSTYFGSLSITWMLDKNHSLASRCKIQARTCSIVSKCSWHFCYLFQLQIRRKWEIIKCEWWEAFDTILTFLTRHLYPCHNSLWTGSQFFLGKKIAKGKEMGGREPFLLFPLSSSPLDQRPVHRLYHKWSMTKNKRIVSAH